MPRYCRAFNCVPSFVERLGSLLAAEGFEVRERRYYIGGKALPEPTALTARRGGAEVTILIDTDLEGWRKNLLHGDPKDSLETAHAMERHRIAWNIPPVRPRNSAMTARLSLSCRSTLLDVIRTKFNPAYRNRHDQAADEIERIMLREGVGEIESYFVEPSPR